MTLRSRIKVNVERVDIGCGSIGHLTVDQIRSAIREDLTVEMTCPECGRIHLTLEDVIEAEARLVTRTRRYRLLQSQAEAEPGEE